MQRYRAWCVSRRHSPVFMVHADYGTVETLEDDYVGVAFDCQIHAGLPLDFVTRIG
jgi:hypothetical protein